MRLSVLSRPVVAGAALAVGSAVLAAVPATATTAADITRDQVLNAAKLVRADPNAAAGDPSKLKPTTARAVRVLANRACSVNFDDEITLQAFALPIESDEVVDGLAVLALVLDPNNLSDMSGRMCAFGVLAPMKSSATLSGTAQVTTSDTRRYALSGDVFASPGRSFTAGAVPFDLENLALTASGNATTSVKTTTAKTVKTPKTKAQKKAAKKKYNAALKSAKKAYDKDLKKAGSSKSKKASAKKAYDKKKSAAKAAYKKRTATKKIVKVTSVKKTPTPFTVQTTPFSFPD